MKEKLDPKVKFKRSYDLLNKKFKSFEFVIFISNLKMSLQTANIVELNSKYLESLLKVEYFTFLNETELARVRRDFSKGYFKGLVCLEEDSTIKGFILFCNFYSTWQHRVLFVSDIWLESNLDYKGREAILKGLIDHLFEIARKNAYSRVNTYVKKENPELIQMLTDMKAINLTIEEDWFIFEMGKEEMKDFMNQESTNQSNFEILKVSDINKFAGLIKNSINKLAIFEKLEEQFETTEAELVRDFDEKNKFYETIVIYKKDSEDISLVGFSIYFLFYQIEKGLGIYLEDLFIEKEYRNSGLGTFLWQSVVRDVFSTNDVSYMRWNVLGWNKSAIEFYYKYKSVNLTQDKGLESFRFIKKVLYS